MKRSLLTGLFFVLLLILFTGLGDLLAKRYRMGDVFPPYSTRRSDPKGCKALFRSLRQLQDLRVERNVHPWSQRDNPEDATVLVAGITPKWSLPWMKQNLKRIDDIARGGNTVVLCFAPYTANSKAPWSRRARQATPPPLVKSEKNEDDIEAGEKPLETYPGTQEDGKSSSESNIEEEGEKDFESMQRAWKATTVEALKDGHKTAVVEPGVWPELAEREIPWLSNLGLMMGSNNMVRVRCDNAAVLLERKVGQGRMFICADSYFLSNEAMLLHPSAGFVCQLLGQHPTLIIDETQLGAAANTGLLAIMKRFGMLGLLVGGLMVLGLWLWRQLFPLVPIEQRLPDGDQPVALAGPAGGMRRLLYGHLSVKDWVPAALDRLRASKNLLPLRMRHRVDSIDEEMLPKDPLAAYRRIQEDFARPLKISTPLSTIPSESRPKESHHAPES